MVVSGESQPDHSTLAAFVSKLGDEVAKLFAQVLVLPSSTLPRPKPAAAPNESIAWP